MVLKNIYLDKEGLHKNKPIACKVTGILTIKIDNKSVRVKQCNNAKPKSRIYLSIEQKNRARSMHKRKSPRSQKTLVKKKIISKKRMKANI